MPTARFVEGIASWIFLCLNTLWRRRGMARLNDRVIDEALSPPADARLNLVEKLLTSLNLPVDEEIDRLWAEEAERRVSPIEAGEAKLVPGEDVFKRIRV
jgi:putative addiction module component (TIGR02574 family)